MLSYKPVQMTSSSIFILLKIFTNCWRLITMQPMKISNSITEGKWHPDKHGGDNAVTANFQEINEAYSVLSDPAKRIEYDLTGIYEIEKYSLQECLARFKGMILTCNGLGIDRTQMWSQQLTESVESHNK